MFVFQARRTSRAALLHAGEVPGGRVSSGGRPAGVEHLRGRRVGCGGRCGGLGPGGRCHDNDMSLVRWGAANDE